MKCEFCLEEFTCDNVKARFCSDKCRVYFSRRKNKGPIGDVPDTSDVKEVALEASYHVLGVDAFWCKPHKLVFHSNSEWRGCCVDVDTWEAKCPRTGDVVTGKSYAEMMAKAREVARKHVTEEVSGPSWAAWMPQSVKPPRAMDGSQSQLVGSKSKP